MEIWIYAGIFVLIAVSIPLVFALSLAIATRRAARQAEQERLRIEAALATAVLAEATLISARTTHTRAADGVNLVRVTLQVQPPEGQPYMAVNTWEVGIGSTPQLTNGTHLSVMIDSENPKKVYPNFAWARMSTRE